MPCPSDLLIRDFAGGALGALARNDVDGTTLMSASIAAMQWPTWSRCRAWARRRPRMVCAPARSSGAMSVLGLVGRGGMGEVYAAHDPELDRKVALKLVRDDVAPNPDDVSIERMQREAQTMAKAVPPQRHRGLRRRRGGPGAVHRHAVHQWSNPGRLGW